MNLSLEKERAELEALEHYVGLRICTETYGAEELEKQRTLVTALEQLEQAREALEEIAAKSFDTGAREYAAEALKQQEVGNE